jgi:hypothetical protein
MVQHPYDFFPNFFVYYIPTSTSLIRILSPRKVLGHTKKKNERNKRGLHIYTWVFLTLLRVFVVNHPLKNAEPLLEFSFRKCKKLLNTRLLEITAPHLQFQNARVGKCNFI